jgi:hypothetical protein
MLPHIWIREKGMRIIQQANINNMKSWTYFVSCCYFFVYIIIYWYCILLLSRLKSNILPLLGHEFPTRDNVIWCEIVEKRVNRKKKTSFLVENQLYFKNRVQSILGSQRPRIYTRIYTHTHMKHLKCNVVILQALKHTTVGTMSQQLPSH